jgi:hypothetical protein
MMRTTVNQTACTLTRAPHNSEFLLQVHCSGALYAEFHGTGTVYEFIASIREDLKSSSDLDICLANLQQKIRE